LVLVLLILTVVRPFSLFTTTLLMMLALGGCAQKSAEPDEKIDIPKPAVAAPPTDTRPVVLCFGDSITAGFGIDAGQTYPDILQKILDDKGYKYQVVNAGISGDTTSGGVDRLNEAIKLQPKVTLLELGGNDGLRGIGVHKSRDNLMQISRRLETNGSKILVLGITLPRNYGPDYIRDFEGMYKAIAVNSKYPFMPFVLEGVYNQPGMMQADGIHPTAKGAATVANNVFKYLQPLLTK
jgi:acyl-CoA thioesterase-1